MGPASLEPGGADRDLAHRRAILPGFAALGRASSTFGAVAMTPRRDYLCAMIKIRLLLVGALVLVALSPAPSFAAKKPKPKPAPAAAAAGAADPGPAKSLGSAGSWTAYLAQNKAGKVCYLVGQPEKTEPAGDEAQAALMAMVTHRTDGQCQQRRQLRRGLSAERGRRRRRRGRRATNSRCSPRTTRAWARTSELDKTIVATLAKEKAGGGQGHAAKGHADHRHLLARRVSPRRLALIDKACDIKRRTSADARRLNAHMRGDAED